MNLYIACPKKVLPCLLHIFNLFSKIRISSLEGKLFLIEFRVLFNVSATGKLNISLILPSLHFQDK